MSVPGEHYQSGAIKAAENIWTDGLDLGASYANAAMAVAERVYLVGGNEARSREYSIQPLK